MISLITSLYHSDKYLKKYLRRVEVFARELIRSDINFEIIAIANDPSLEENSLLQNFADSNKYFHYHQVPRESLYATWNRGVRLAEGSVVGFWNVDDVRFSSAIIKGLKNIEDGCDLVYFPFVYKRYIKLLGVLLLVKKITINPIGFAREQFKRGMYIGPFFIFKKQFFNQVGPFDESLRIAGDYDWQVRAALKSDLFLSDEVAGIFTNDGSGLSGRKDIRQQEENSIIDSRYK